MNLPFFTKTKTESVANIESEGKDNSIKGILIEVIETVISSGIVLVIVYNFIALPIIVSGESMVPNLHTGERLLVEKVTKHFKSYERGEIVILHPPQNERVEYVKRVIGVPGDIVKILECNVYISRDGMRFVLEEPYLPESLCTVGGPAIREGRSLRIEDGYYFVLGDNRMKSADSRVFGVVEEDKIVGRAAFRFWPLNKVGLL